MDARGRQPNRMERRQANRPPRYNHLHLGGPVRAQPAGTSSIQARTPLGCQLAIAPLLEDRRAGRRRSPHPRSRHSPRANAAACLAITSPVERAAEAQHHRSRSRSSTTPPDTSDSSRKPLPLGPPNVAGFSGEAERSEVSSAASRCWTARHEVAVERTAMKDSSRRSRPPTKTRQPERTARGACQPAAPRTRRAASETFAGGEASLRNATASEGAAAKTRWSERRRPDGCPRGQPDRTERRQAIWPPRYNHLHLGGPVRARQARRPLNSSRNAIPAASSRQLQPQRTTAQTTLQPAPAITLQPTRHRSGMARDHASGCAGRRSTTPPAAISIRDDAPRHERQLAKTLSLSIRPT